MLDEQLSANEQIGADLFELAASYLEKLKHPAVLSYEIGRLIFSKTASTNADLLKQHYQRLLESLLSVRLLTPIRSNPKVLGYLLFGRNLASPAEIACSLDPFSYISHLNAMEYYGLTDRFPKTLYMCTPPSKEWREQATQRMQKDLGGETERYVASGLPRLAKPALSMIGKTAVQFHGRTQMGAFRSVSESSLRVATMGRVFLDMLREPWLCGGIQHVLDIYRREGKRYLGLIVDEVDRHGQPIDKIRAGYVLTEVCHLSSEIVDQWTRFAQRGGSRKLDPESEHSSSYSKRWMLSLNVPSLLSDDIEDI